MSFPHVPVQHAKMRSINASIILNQLRLNPYLTRADLAARIGLTRSAVSSLVDQLISLNYVKELGTTPPKQISGGRPGTSLSLNPDGGVSIGLEIKDTLLSVVSIDLVGQLIAEKHLEIESNQFSYVYGEATRMIRQSMDEILDSGRKVLGIGAAVQGLVNPNDGEISVAPSLGWHRIPLMEKLRNEFQVPVILTNDASASAVGEHYFGIARNCDHFIYLETGDHGIGAGVFIQGKLFHGLQGYAGEVGHMVMNPAGEICHCGRQGCWEAEIAMANIRKKLISAVKMGRKTEFKISDIERMTMNQIAEAAERGDPLAREMMSDIKMKIQIGMANLVNIFNPEKIVLGRMLKTMSRYFLEDLRAYISKQCLKGPAEAVEIAVSGLENACTHGAAALILDAVFNNPIME